MNFLVDGGDAWDSTPAQEVFIQNYFKKDESNMVSKRSRKRKKHALSSDIASTSTMSSYFENKTPIKIPKQKNPNKKSKLTSSTDLEAFPEKYKSEENMAESDVSTSFTNKSLCEESLFKSSKSGSFKMKKLLQNSSKNKKDISSIKERTNDVNVVDESSKRNFQNNDSPSKKINSKKNKNSSTVKTLSDKSLVAEANIKLKTKKNTSISKEKYLNRDGLDDFKNKVVQSKLQNLKKRNSKANKAPQIQNEPSTSKSYSKAKVPKKTSNSNKNVFSILKSDQSEDNLIPSELQKLKKRKSKASKPSTDKSDDSEDEVAENELQNVKKKKENSSKPSTNKSGDFEDEVPYNKLQNPKKRKSKTSKPSTDESIESEDEVSQNELQNLKKKKSKISKASQVKDKSSSTETNRKTNKLNRTKNTAGSKQTCLNVEDSEDDEVIRSELQNSRILLKIQKLMKVAPHLNPNFVKGSTTKEDNADFEEISTEDSSSQSDGEYSSAQSDGEYSSESENEVVLKTNKKESSEDLLNSNEEDSSESEEGVEGSQESNLATSKQEIPVQRLETYIQKTSNVKKPNSILEKARAKMASAKFRFLNEKLYTESGGEAFRYFQENKEEFEDYHLGYGQQVSKWPLNPVDEILVALQKLNKDAVIADLGCGDAKIARVLTNRTVHSFDLVAMHKCVTACDISKVPLRDGSVDVAVFCLSLMGVNLVDYLREAYRILKIGATLKIAEVESRIVDLDLFIKNLNTLGFELEKKNTKNKLFVFLDLKKVKKGKAAKTTTITLRPCMYKKR